MPKTHMGWAKRTIEKEKAEMEAKKREEEQKLQRLQQMQMQHVLGQARRPATALQLSTAGGGRGPRSDLPSGPNLPRTRSDTELHLGTVLEWRGKFGWLQPLEPIEHPLAHKHGGRVYIAKQDVIAGGVMGAGLTPGQTCQFRVYSDASGLGAEQCQVLN